MSCCGKEREQWRATHGGQAARQQVPGGGRVVFEYTGPATAVVKGAVTGRGYAFAGYGARAVVDARDTLSLLRMPYLQRVGREE